MKKITFIMAAIMAVTGSFAQDQVKSAHVKNAASRHTVKNTQMMQRNGQIQAAAIIYTQDFNGGFPADWVISDSAGNGEVWAHTTTGPGNTLIDPLASTTAANGWMIADDDSWGNNSTQASTSMTSSAINCSSNTVVMLTLDEHFLQYLTGEGVIYVSNDSVTWTEVHRAEAGLIQDEETANPFRPVIDISSVAANQATVYLRFTYRGDWDYLWQVDDIQLFEPAAADGGVSNVLAPLSGCDLNANTPVAVEITNFGTGSISNFPVSITVNGGTPIVENITATIAPGATYIYNFTATIDLSVAGAYTIAASTAVPSDGNTTNDMTSVNVNMSSANTLTTDLVMGFEPGQDLSTWSIQDGNNDGSTWEINAPINTWVHSGGFCLRKPGSGAGSPPEDDDYLFTPCLQLTAGMTYYLDYWFKIFDLIAPCRFDVRVGTSADASAMTQIIAAPPIPSDTTYQQGTPSFTVAASGIYYIGFHAYMNPGEGGSSSLRIDDITVTTTVGIDENNATAKWFDVYPSPASEDITVRMNRPFDVAQVEVINALGSVVYKSNINNAFTSINLSNLESGIYTAKLTVDGKDAVKRFTIAK